MSLHVQPSLASLYEEDETAWLELTAQLVAEGRFEELDCVNLSEYLSDMAKRDRRQIFSRLVVLLTHLLKWEYQPEHRSNSWRGTIRAQLRDLRWLLKGGVLRKQAEEVLPAAYEDAIEQAAVETGLFETTFPSTLTFTLDELLAKEPPA